MSSDLSRSDFSRSNATSSTGSMSGLGHTNDSLKSVSVNSSSFSPPRSKMLRLVLACRAAQPCSRFWRTRGLQFGRLQTERDFMLAVLYPVRYFQVVAVFAGVFSVVGICIVAVLDFDLHEVEISLPDKFLLAAGLALCVVSAVIALRPQDRLHRHWPFLSMAIVLGCQVCSLIAMMTHNVSVSAFGQNPQLLSNFSDIVANASEYSDVCHADFRDGKSYGTVL